MTEPRIARNRSWKFAAWKRTVALVVGLAARAVAASAPAGELPLMPWPAQLTAAQGSMTLDAGFGVSSTYRDARLESAIQRFTVRIARQTGIEVVGGGRGLAIECLEPGANPPALGEDESYRLEVSPAGAKLTASTVTGALRGMETFAQLIQRGRVPSVTIEDRPRFPWRGLMMDVSRHWMPVEVVKRNLDAMAAVKLNVLHWHLSDDQGVRVESKRYPRLAAAASDGHFYSQDEIRDVVAYAAARAIRVIPEFDMPGHTTALLAAYPELASAPGPYSIERAWGIFKPVLDASREETFTFLDGFLGEMAALFPDPYFHIGGDEVEDTRARELQPRFNLRVQALLLKHGKKVVGWDEILQRSLAKGTVIQSWRGPAAMAEAARQGYRGILSYGYYLDYLKPASFHYAVQPPDDSLGGEACMWAEYANAETLDSRIWPRMAAVAERFWSPREVADVGSMYARLEAVSRVLEWTGIRHRSGYQPMLDRLGGNSDALRVLAEASEATGIDVRRDARKYTSLVALNRFVDAVRPESESVRRLERAARAGDTAALRAAFEQWAAIEGCIEIEELKPLAANLARVGRIGLRALQGAPADWASEQKAALAEMEKPSAEVVLAAVRPVRVLLEK